MHDVGIAYGASVLLLSLKTNKKIKKRHPQNKYRDMKSWIGICQWYAHFKLRSPLIEYLPPVTVGPSWRHSGKPFLDGAWFVRVEVVEQSKLDWRGMTDWDVLCKLVSPFFFVRLRRRCLRLVNALVYSISFALGVTTTVRAERPCAHGLFIHQL